MQKPNLLKQEMEDRSRVLDLSTNNYRNAIQGHTKLDEINGVEYLDMNSFDPQESLTYDIASAQLYRATIQDLIFKEFIREKSGLDFDTALVLSSVDQISRYEKLKNQNAFVDLISLELNKETEEFAYILGVKFPINLLKNQTPEYQKYMYFSMIENALKKYGYDDSEIEACISEIAQEMGGKSQQIK